jgi:hypothetical protein
MAPPSSLRPGVLLLGIVVALPACSSDHPIAPTVGAKNPGSGSPPAAVWPGTLSGAVTPVPGAAVLGVQAGEHAAYIGLPPGTIPSGVRVDISSQRTLALSYVREGAIVNGGFDPLGIAAEVGDTLRIVINRADGTTVIYSPVVQDPGRPVVVRLSPAAGTSNLPLNADLYAVFSEPILPSSQPAGAMRLLKSGAPVAGQLHARDSESLMISFEPAAVLDPGASYQIDVTTNVVTPAGRSLATAVQGAFTTMGSPLPSTLAVQSFSMIEYQYPSTPGWWSYAPQILVAETSGHGSITILRLDVSIPGFGPAPGFCSTGIHVAAGSSHNVVGELYGDYELSYDDNGKRAGSGDATLVITYSDETGRMGTVSAKGPIVPGALPTTYTGGQSSMSPGQC